MESSGNEDSVYTGEEAPMNTQESLVQVNHHDHPDIRYNQTIEGENYVKEFVKVVALEKLPLDFGEKLGFIDFCRKTLIPNNDLCEYDHADYVKQFAKMVAVENLPFDFGERVGFIEFCRSALNPAACSISGETVTHTLYNIYRKKKRSLVKFFKDYKGCISICADIWSNHWQTCSYLGVSCHFIDDGWVMQKRVLAFRVLDESHTADDIYRMMKTIFEEFSIEHKIFTIGFDNVLNSTDFVPQLNALCDPRFGGRFFHQRCACHVLNLCAQNGLEVLRSHVKPVTDALNYLWKHHRAMKSWIEFCKSNGKLPIQFPRDIPMNWTLTYELLSKSYEYKDLLVTFMHYNTTDIILYPEHWDPCNKICWLLQVFNDAYKALSNIYYPTAHSFFVEALNVVGALSEHENDELLSSCVAVMKAKWLEYYRNIPVIYMIALCFDPRCKLNGLLDFLTSYYQCLRLNDVQVVSVYDDVKDLFYQLHNEYLRLYSALLQTVVQTPENVYQGLGHELLSIRMKRQRALCSSSTCISEIDDYLETSFEFLEKGEFNIQEWWRIHEKRFPVLAVIAKEILGMPVSGVVVEQECSTRENVLDERRSVMVPTMAEVQVCVGDWIKARRRQQEMDHPSGIFDFFEDNDDQTTSEDDD